MSDDNANPAADLAFLKNLVEDGSGRTQYRAGLLFTIAGGLYGFQCLANWLMIVSGKEFSQFLWMLIGFAPTVIFLIVVVWMIATDKKPNQGGATARGVNAAFQAAGITNLAFICIFAPAAFRMENFEIWLFYPAVVFALQGAAWLIAYMLRKRAWLAFVAGGWFVSSVALGLLIGAHLYLVVAGLALILLMMVPGLTMMRLARAERRAA